MELENQLYILQCILTELAEQLLHEFEDAYHNGWTYELIADLENTCVHAIYLHSALARDRDLEGVLDRYDTLDRDLVSAHIQSVSDNYTPPSLPPALCDRLRNAFTASPHFASDAALHTLFVDTRLAPWRNLIPDNIPNRTARVNSLIQILYDKANTVGENALVLFLHVLAENTDPDDALHTTLTDLATALTYIIPAARSAA